MKNLIGYNETGAILFSYGTTETLDTFKSSQQHKEGISYLELPKATQELSGIYVDITTTPHKIKQKHSLDISISKTTLLADGVDEAVISNIPNGTLVTWPDGQVDEVSDGVVRFSTTQPSIDVLKFEGLKHLTKEVVFEAHV